MEAWEGICSPRYSPPSSHTSLNTKIKLNSWALRLFRAYGKGKEVAFFNLYFTHVLFDIYIKKVFLNLNLKIKMEISM